MANGKDQNQSMFDLAGYFGNEQGMFPDLYGKSTTQSVKDITGAGPNEGYINDRLPFIGTKDKVLNTFTTGLTGDPFDYDASQSRNIQTQHDPLGEFDINDPNQIKALQRRLGVKDDGIFGPKTEKAYRAAVNEQRTGEGQDPYVYNDDSMASMAMNNEQSSQEPIDYSGETEATPRDLRQMDRRFRQNERKRNRQERRRARKEARYDRRFSRAENRALDDKKVWNKKFRDILNEQEAAGESWDTNPYRKEQPPTTPGAPPPPVDYGSGESVDPNQQYPTNVADAGSPVTPPQPEVGSSYNYTTPEEQVGAYNSSFDDNMQAGGAKEQGYWSPAQQTWMFQHGAPNTAGGNFEEGEKFLQESGFYNR